MTDKQYIACDSGNNEEVIVTGNVHFYSPEELYNITFNAPPITSINNSDPTDAQQFLLRAAELQQERGKQYDGANNKERSMGKTIVAFNAITGKNISESEGWLLLQLLKDVRQWTKKEYHADSAEDCIAYAALKAEALANGK